MIKIFLDTNIIADWLFGREGEGLAEELLNIGNKPFSAVYTSVLSMSNLAYLSRRGHDSKYVLAQMNKVSAYCNILNDGDFYSALKNGSPDFEDALQISCAESKDCDVIITHNIKHFRGYTYIPVYTPEEFLSKCEG